MQPGVAASSTTMIVTLILVVVAFLALGFFVKLAKVCASISDVLENPVEYLRAVDIEAFRNLVDPKKEKFLRANLSPAKFRKIQRQRLRAAVEYVSCAAQNAAILLPLADAGRRSPDPATAEAAESWLTARFAYGFMLSKPSRGFTSA